jgi:hypothetical protein
MKLKLILAALATTTLLSVGIAKAEPASTPVQPRLPLPLQPRPLVRRSRSNARSRQMPRASMARNAANFAASA